MTKWIIGVVVVAIIVIAVFLVFSPRERPESVKIGYLPIITSLPVYIAQENDYMGQGGIDAEFIQLQSSNQEIEALIRGDLDIVAISSAVPAFIVETIDPGKMEIFSVSELPKEDQPFDSIIAKMGSAINNITDLEGKKIGVFPGSTATNLLEKYLISKGVDISGVGFIPITPPNQLPALYEGSIDAIHSYEPITTIAIESGDFKRIHKSVYAEQLNNNQGVALVSRSFIETRPEIASRAIAALNMAFDFSRQEEQQSRVLLVKYMKLDSAVAENVVLAHMLRHDEIDSTAMQDYADRLYYLGELESRVNVSSMFYTILE